MSKESCDRSIDPATLELMQPQAGDDLEFTWDRYDAQQPQCGFGRLGVCCRLCAMGPCRIDPFGNGPQKGVCGATADIIAARNLVRKIAGGSAAHSDHGRDVAHTLLMAAIDPNCDYKVVDEKKLRALADEFGLESEGKSKDELAKAVAELCFGQFGQQHGEMVFAQRAPEEQKRRWRENRVMPRGVDREIVEMMHRTVMGVDNDMKNIIMGGVRTALADGWGGSMIATELSDVLFGRPDPLGSTVNLGVLKDDSVNVVIHGHEPNLSEMLVAASQDPELIKLAESKGAKGITLAGICCTANEMLMRHGIPIAGNFLQQELAIASGAVDAMVVDVQCVMPSLGALAKRFKTKLISTSPKAKFPLAEHIEFEESKAIEIAKRILTKAVENYPNREKQKTSIPDVREKMVAGFTAESVYEFLGGRYRPSYRPLNEAIITGRLRGAAAIVGCNNTKVKHDFGHVAMAKELLANDVLVVTTGCTAIACAKSGLLDPGGALKYCGKGLAEVCRAVGLPPVLHMGSCVDNSRVMVVLCNIVKQGGLGDSIADLPAAGAAPEWTSEKAVAIGFYVVASGVYTVLGQPLPIQGSKELTKFLCEDIEEIFGGKFAFEEDPIKGAHMILDHIDRKRSDLKLVPVLYPVPYEPKTVAEAAKAV